MKTLLNFLIALSIIIGAATNTNAQTSVKISVRIGPPALPVYTQPYCPGEGYLWVPGYWAYDQDGYYWVPGTWVLPPEYGLLWTPGYWDYNDGYYLWHEGYWAHHVGFYGGIDYGFGYGGISYCGGEWRGNSFTYNTAVNNINTTIIHNTYVNRTIVNNTTVPNSRHLSFHGRGGITVRPTQQEELTSRESHVKPTSFQMSVVSSARVNKRQFVSFNHGHPQKLVETTVRKDATINRQNPQVNATNEKRQVQQHQQQIKNQQVNAANEKRQVQQQQIKNQQVNAANEKRQMQQQQQQIRSQQANATNERRQVQQHQQQIKNQQMNAQHQQPQPRNSGLAKADNKRKDREK